AARGTFHFIGVQVVSAGTFQSVTPGGFASSIGDVYDQLIAAHPGSIRGFVSDAAFWDIGTVADYWRTSVAFAESGDGQLAVGRNVHLAPGARLTRSILWDEIVVEEGAVLDECI